MKHPSASLRFFPGGKVPQPMRVRSRRIIFWINATVTLLYLVALGYAHARGREDMEAWFIVLAAAHAILCVVAAIRVYKVGGGLLAKSIGPV